MFKCQGKVFTVIKMAINMMVTGKRMIKKGRENSLIQMVTYILVNLIMINKQVRDQKLGLMVHNLKGNLKMD